MRPLNLSLVLVLFATSVSLSQEKDPGEKQKKEIKAAIEQYIRDDQKLKGGFFINDAKEARVLILSFEELHKGVGQGEGGTSVVCADFKDAEGKLYDLDVQVREAGTSWAVERIMIHKVDGEVRE